MLAVNIGSNADLNSRMLCTSRSPPHIKTISNRQREKRRERKRKFHFHVEFEQQFGDPLRLKITSAIDTMQTLTLSMHIFLCNGSKFHLQQTICWQYGQRPARWSAPHMLPCVFRKVNGCIKHKLKFARTTPREANCTHAKRAPIQTCCGRVGS